jgi:DNA-binding helix-hairpin-helix protein with protein kinase domain
MSFIKNLLAFPFRKFKEFQKDLLTKSAALDEQIGKMRMDVKGLTKERKDAELAAEKQSIDATDELTKYVDSFVNEATEMKTKWTPMLEMDKRLRRGEDINPEELIHAMMKSGVFDPSKNALENFEQLRTDLDTFNARQEHVQNHLNKVRQQVEQDKAQLQSKIDEHTSEMVKIMRNKLEQRDEDVAKMREELANKFSKKSSDVTKA